MPKKGGARKGQPAGSRLAYDDTKQEKKKVKRKLTAWNIHAKKVYNEGKKKNSDYKFSQALKDAKKTYKK